MKLIKELIEINPNPPVFSSLKDIPASKSKLEILFEGVKNKTILSDEQASQLLYGSIDQLSNLQRLKSRLANKLIDGVLISSASGNDFSSYEKAYLNCHRNWTIIKLLYAKGARTTAIRLCERTIGYAKKYEFTDLQFLISRELRNHFALVDYNKYKKNKFQSQFEQSQNLYQAETEVEQYYNEAQYHSLNARGTVNQNVLTELDQYIERIEELISKYNSYRLLFIGYMTFSIRHQYSYDFAAMLKVCNEAAEIFKNRAVTTKVAQFNFDLRRMVCFMQMENYQESDEIAVHYLDSIRQGTYNWYYILFYYYTSYMHRGQYALAQKNLYNGLKHKNFKSLAKSLQQIFIVNEAYLKFLESIDALESTNTDQSSFRLYKFLNEIPIFSKDKRGLNISILVIHFLFLLQQKKYNMIIDRVDALRQYTHRYLKKDDTFRSNCFINMLLSITKAEFNRIRAERYAADYVKALKEKPLYLAEQGIEVEIIPYERLWKLTLELLD